MLDVFKVFYPTHYNLAALSILLFLLLIFLLSKKNLRAGVVVLALFIALNMAIYKKTANKTWTIEVTPAEKSVDSFGNSYYSEPETMTFSIQKWTITDEKGEVHHWCWVEDIWEVISNTDIIAGIWGENVSKKVKKSTESRIEDANNLGK